MSWRLGEARPVWCMTLDVWFCCFFLLEFAMRVFVLRLDYFKSFGNLFDFSLVVLGVVDLLSKSSMNVREAMLFKFARSLRMLGGFRVLRVISFVEELGSLVYLLRCSCTSFFWTLVLMTGTTFAFAAFLTQASTSVRSTEAHVLNVSLELRQAKHTQLYGSLGCSMYTLITLVTGGMDWAEAVEFLDAFEQALTVTYIALNVLVLMNLVTGVFVETAARVRQSDNERAFRRGLRKAAHQAHVSASAPLTPEHFKRVLKQKHLPEFMAKCNIDTASALKVFTMLWNLRGGRLTLIDFVDFVITEQHATPLEFAKLRLQEARHGKEIREMHHQAAIERVQLLEYTKDGLQEHKHLSEKVEAIARSLLGREGQLNSNQLEFVPEARETMRQMPVQDHSRMKL